jgi:hypothetical protein
MVHGSWFMVHGSWFRVQVFGVRQHPDFNLLLGRDRADD